MRTAGDDANICHRRSQAAGFGVAHDAMLARLGWPGMGLTPGGTVAAEDIIHLQRAAHG